MADPVSRQATADAHTATPKEAEAQVQDPEVGREPAVLPVFGDGTADPKDPNSGAQAGPRTGCDPRGVQVPRDPMTFDGIQKRDQDPHSQSVKDKVAQFA